MSRSLKYAAAASSLILLSTGCATMRSEGGEGIYRDSSTDIVNRAPNSMSLPAHGTTPLVDAVHLRSKADYHFALAESHALEGDTVHAIEEYKLTLIYDSKSAPVRLRLAAEYVKQGLVSEALEQAKEALELDPRYVEAHLLLGGLYSALRMYDDALGEYRAVIKIEPNNVEAPLFIGALLAEQKKFAEAAEQFEKLASVPGNSNAHMAWYYLGRVRLEENREKHVSKAEAAFHQSLNAKPSYLDAAVALGQLLESTGRRTQAISRFLAYQEKHGPSPAVAEELSRLFIEDHDYTRAYDQFSIMEAADPSDLNVKAKMAFILIEQKKYRDAITRMEEVLSMEPSSDKIRFYLGAVYEEVKDYPAAISHFVKVPVTSSYYTESVVHVSYLYKLQNDYPKAIEAIRAGIKEKDDHPQFYALYASLLDDKKEYSKAAVMLKDAVKKFPEHAQLHFFLGNMHDRLGERTKTIDSMKKVLEIEKDHVQALNYLAYTYAEDGKNLDEAEKMVRRALDLQPDDGYILDTLGWVLFKRGKYAESIRVLEAAVKIQPNESVIAEHLGDAYYQQQMPDKAKVYYQRAAESETNVATLAKIRSKLAAIDRQIPLLPSEDRKPASANSQQVRPAN